MGIDTLGTVASYQRHVVAGGGFFLLLNLGPGAAACGMWIDTLGTVASYQRHVVAGGRFFSPIESGPRGLWNGDRDKHWVQLLLKIK